MERAVAYTRINEKARLEWVDRANLQVRVRYENLFYGACTIDAKLRMEDDGFYIRDDHLAFSGFLIKNGSPGALESMARDFAQLSLRRHPDFAVHRTARSASPGGLRLSELMALIRKWKRAVFGDSSGANNRAPIG